MISVHVYIYIYILYYPYLYVNKYYMCSKYNPCTPKNSTNISVINSTRIGTCYGALIHPTIDHGLGWWHQWPKGTTKTGLLLYTPEKLTWQWKNQPFQDVAPIKNAEFPIVRILGGSNFDHVFTYRNMFHWTSRIPFQKKQRTYLLSCLIRMFVLFLGKFSSSHAFSVSLWMLLKVSWNTLKIQKQLFRDTHTVSSVQIGQQIVPFPKTGLMCLGVAKKTLGPPPTNFSRWWLNQPIWKILVNRESSRSRGEKQIYLKRHHIVLFWWSPQKLVLPIYVTSFS